MSALLSPRPSTLSREEFIAAYGSIFESSPWVAEAVWPEVASGLFDYAESMGDYMRAAVADANEERKLALLRAHPDLAGKLALAGKLTADSASEQRSAGLDACTPEELAEFQKLNSAYKEKFGFPFIIAVRGKTRHDILAAFRARLPNSRAQEMAMALEQVGRIAQLRLNDRAAS
jgi:OHCU decarboxylase